MLVPSLARTGRVLSPSLAVLGLFVRRRHTGEFADLGHVVPVALEVLHERDVLLLDTFLVQVADKEEGNDARHDGQGRRHVKVTGVRRGRGRVAGVEPGGDLGERIGPCHVSEYYFSIVCWEKTGRLAGECTNLADGGGDAVELSTHHGARRLGGDET